MSRSDLPLELQDVQKLQGFLKTKPENYWIERGESMALNLFHKMASRVPAYKDFLVNNKVNPENIRTIKDFKTLPTVNKDNYLRKYSRKELCWDGEFANQRWVISTTSGSTGKPFYFPRTDLQDEYYALTAELYLRENFQIQNKNTLYIDAFAMGAWIGGVFTYEAVKKVAEQGYSLSIITPGINKAEVINSVRELGPEFDQVIIGCYPPIMKDIIDLGIEDGLDWSKYNLGIVFSAEGFSEEFRDYISKYGKLANDYTSTLNHYGTVDLGTMSHETPISILLRRQAIKDAGLYKSIFGETTKLPTLTQFMPEMFFFEEQNGQLLCSSHSGLPLIRYDLKDNGGCITLEDVKKIYKRNDKNLDIESEKVGINSTQWNLPFVFLYERSDFSVTFSGAQIYAEEVRKALLVPELTFKVTGKFTMISSYDKNAQNSLEINVELRKNVNASKKLEDDICASIVNTLLEGNSEYRILYGESKMKTKPLINTWQNNHPLHFSGQGKQKWVKKS